MKELLEKAKRDYPVGTHFIPPHAYNDSSSCIITEDTTFEILNNEKIVASVNGRVWMDEKKYGNTTYNRYVYYNNDWAKIIKKAEPLNNIHELW